MVLKKNAVTTAKKIVLKAQQLGLSTCWVGLSYSKGKSNVVVRPGEKLLMVISIGYGDEPGREHTNKPLEKLCKSDTPMPGWFKDGVLAAQLAPTAMNQQKFRFELEKGRVKATAGIGFYTKVDLGIVKYHFEIGAGQEGWQWA